MNAVDDPNYPNVFYIGDLVNIFLTEKDDVNENVPEKFRYLLKEELITYDKNDQEKRISVKDNKKGDKLSSKLTFYIGNDNENKIVSFMILPKIFKVDGSLEYKEWYDLYKNIFEELSKYNKVNSALINNNKKNNPVTVFDFLLIEYLEKLNKLQSLIINMNYSSSTYNIKADKMIGEIKYNNWMQNGKNPICIPQKVKKKIVNEIMILIYESMSYLKQRINPLPDSITKKEVIKKINYIQHKVNSNKNFIKKIKGNDFRTQVSSLKRKFNKYNKSEDVKNNPKIIRQLKLLFESELNENAILIKTFNMTKIWENLLEDTLNLNEKQNSRVFFGDIIKCWSSKPDGYNQSENIVYDFKYKSLDEGVKSISESDISKLIRDIIVIEKTENLKKIPKGILIYPEEIKIKSGDIPEFKLKLTQEEPNYIKNDNSVFSEIKIAYQKYQMFSKK